VATVRARFLDHPGAVLQALVVVAMPFTEVTATWIQASVAVSRSGNAYADFWGD